MIFLVIPLTLAQNTINKTGTIDGNFDFTDDVDIGFFNEQLSSVDVNAQSQSASLGNARGQPLIADLDGDGVKEIIVMDSGDIRLFNRDVNGISVVDTAETGSATDDMSNHIVFDIDGDGRGEVIVVNPRGVTDASIFIADWNGTDFVIQNTLNITGLSNLLIGTSEGFYSEVMIRCGKVNECILAYTDGPDLLPSGGRTSTVSAAFFNSTFVGNEIVLQQDVSSNQAFCFPKLKHIEFKDFDSSFDPVSPTDVEYIFSAMEVTQNTVDEQLVIFYVDIDDDGTVREEKQAQFGVGDPYLAFVTTNCQDDTTAGGNRFAGNLFTSPLVQDSGNGGDPETWIASMVDTNEFNIFKIDAADTSSSEKFPLLADAGGIIISNVFTAAALEGPETSQGPDFCVMGETPVGTGGFLDDDRITVLCASDVNTVAFLDNAQFFLNSKSTVFDFNISLLEEDWFVMAHSVPMKSTDTPNTDEIITSYGVFELDRDSCDVFADCNLNLIFRNPTFDGVSVPIDFQDNDRFDIIHMTNTILFYLDDLFENTGADIDLEASSANPCLDSTWKVNTTVTLLIVVDDFDGDDVSTRVSAYDGTSNEFFTDTGVVNSSFTVNKSSVGGAVFTHSFVANKTIGSGVIKIEARDTGAADLIDIEFISFSVSTVGLEAGDCVGALGVNPDDPAAAGAAGAACTSDTDCNIDNFCNSQNVCQTETDDNLVDNALITGLRSFRLFGLGTTTLWLFFMLAFSLGIWLRAAQIGWTGNSAFGAIAIVNLLFIVVGTRIGVLSTTLVVVLVISIVGILSIFIGRFLTGLGTSGNGG